MVHALAPSAGAFAAGGLADPPRCRAFVAPARYGERVPALTPSSKAAHDFAAKYADAVSEKQLAQSFWRDFFTDVMGISDLLAAGIEFEYPVKLIDGPTNFIDVLWPSIAIIEHKTAGRDLDLAEKQARDYVRALSGEKRPPVVIVSDFRRIRLIDLIGGDRVELTLAELPQHLDRFTEVFGGASSGTWEELDADLKAAELMADLYIEFENAGYTGHDVSVLLIRVLFLLFGDDTRMWRQAEHGLFGKYVESSPESGAGLGGMLQELFQVLDMEKPPESTAPELKRFPYVNGGIFAERLPVFAFTPQMRAALIRAVGYNWSTISPAIFGSMFQTVKSKVDRRILGEHYTSEANILKVIRPLFLDALLERMEKAWDSPAQLKRLRVDLGKMRFLDPACGSGNFLLVTYKRLRDIEARIIVRLQELEGTEGQVGLDGTIGLQVRLEQFHGIEYEEWSSQIATVAMFLADRQANLDLEEVTGAPPDRFPLRDAARIVQGNALQIDWSTVCEMDENTYILGNPPFYGARMQEPSQKADTANVWQGVRGHGELDYVANWFLIAGRLAAQHGVRAAFVSTNSIAQGEQPAIIWGQLTKLGVGIDFAHQTFNWANGTGGAAAVHCVIVGFSTHGKPAKRPLWTYATVKGDPVRTDAATINAYLLDAPEVLVASRSTPLVPGVQPMVFGSMPNDGGHLSNISAEEADAIRRTDPIAAKYLRRIVGSRELIQNIERYCLWLVDVEPSDLRSSAELRKRVSAVREARLSSARAATLKLADRATEFGEIRQPTTTYLGVPSISSSARPYIPIALLSPEIVSNNKLLLVPNASLTTFGVLASRPFNVWNDSFSGRLKNDFQIGVTTTYNCFPYPDLDEAATAAISAAAQAALDARAAYPNASLAVLYDRIAMPQTLRAAHSALDAIVEMSYGLPKGADEQKVLAALLTRYKTLTDGLAATPARGKRKA